MKSSTSRAVTACAALMVAQHACAQYVMRDLGTLGGNGRYDENANTEAPLAVNNLGQIVGASFVDSSTYHAFSWTEAGGMIDVGTLDGRQSIAFDVNDNGQVVGSAQLPDGTSHAFSWTAVGGMVDLGTLGGSTSSAGAVNGNDQVVGGSSLADATTNHAFLWTQAGSMVDLDGRDGLSSWATAVSNAGQVVGFVEDAAHIRRAFSWTREGGIVELGALPASEPQRSQAAAVNDIGQVIGTSGSANYSGIVRGFSWTQAGGLVDIGSLGGWLTEPRAINAAGQVVGVSCLDQATKCHAFLWTQASGMVDLGTLGGMRSRAWDINANGQVVGDSELSDGTVHAFSWTQADGMVDLGSLGGMSIATRVNDRGDIVGSSWLPDGSKRTVLWKTAQAACALLGGDSDNDGICQLADNCPGVANRDQADADNDGLGDGCDPCLTDPYNDANGDGICGGNPFSVAPVTLSVGDVDVGASRAGLFTISTLIPAHLSLTNVSFDAGSSPAFTITSVPALPFDLPPDPASVDVAVTFAPTAAGPASATLLVTIIDPAHPTPATVSVNLTGNGAQEVPSELLSDLLALFDERVAQGTLLGAGPGISATGRLKALQNMLKATGDLVNGGQYSAACRQLADALLKLDGAPVPPDFATGPAAVEVTSDILKVRSALSCN